MLFAAYWASFAGILPMTCEWVEGWKHAAYCER
jgi:hypothetical protein